MKKLILSLVFVFATGTIMNATSYSETTLAGDCTQDAWDWGTESGDGDPILEYEYTNNYFNYYCNEDGTYKEGMQPEPGFEQ